MKKVFVLVVCIALLVGLISGCIEEEKPANKKPSASFTISPATGIYRGLVITFTDASTDEDGTIASWSWDFDSDDVEDSTLQNPTYSYDTAGNYTAKLIVTDDDGAASDAYPMDITVTGVPPTASFSYTPTENITVNVTTVEFTDASTLGDAVITNYTWDFGDGSDLVYDQNTTHMYKVIGNFTITLTVTDADGLTDDYMVTIEVIEQTT